MLSLWGIFVTSFIVALSGALMPGPMLTVTKKINIQANLTNEAYLIFSKNQGFKHFFKNLINLEMMQKNLSR